MSTIIKNYLSRNNSKYLINNKTGQPGLIVRIRPRTVLLRSLQIWVRDTTDQRARKRLQLLSIRWLARVDHLELRVWKTVSTPRMQEHNHSLAVNQTFPIRVTKTLVAVSKRCKVWNRRTPCLRTEDQTQRQLSYPKWPSSNFKNKRTPQWPTHHINTTMHMLKLKDRRWTKAKWIHSICGLQELFQQVKMASSNSVLLQENWKATPSVEWQPSNNTITVLITGLLRAVSCTIARVAIYPRSRSLMYYTEIRASLRYFSETVVVQLGIRIMQAVDLLVLILQLNKHMEWNQLFIISLTNLMDV